MILLQIDWTNTHQIETLMAVLIGISFVIAILVLIKFAWKPFIGMLDRKRELVRQELDDAERMRKEAEELLEKQKVLVTEAEEEAKTIVEKSTERARITHDEIIAQAEKEAKQLVETAQREIELEKQKSIESIRDQLLRLSAKLARDVTTHTLTPEDHHRLIDEAIKQYEAMN
jgi:F-type H+-transporting ATPase subunit b